MVKAKIKEDHQFVKMGYPPEMIAFGFFDHL